MELYWSQILFFLAPLLGTVAGIVLWRNHYSKLALAFFGMVLACGMFNPISYRYFWSIL